MFGEKQKKSIKNPLTDLFLIHTGIEKENVNVKNVTPLFHNAD